MIKAIYSWIISNTYFRSFSTCVILSCTLVLVISVLLVFNGMDVIRLIEGINDLALLTSTGVRTSAKFWKSVWDRNPEPNTSNPHLIAARIISENKEITADDINTVLAHQNISVSENQLKELLNVPSVEIGGVVNKDSLNTIVPSVTVPRTKVNNVQPPTQFGVYCWTNTETGAQYFGSSVDLGARVRDYLKTRRKDVTLRPILNDIRQHGIHKFTLIVWILPDHLATVSNTLVLEQYFILSMTPSNNSLLVANPSPGGKWIAELNSKTMSEAVYLYDNGVLVFKFDSTSGQNDNVVKGTGLYLKEIRSLITSGEPYLGRFILTRIPINPEDENFINVLSMIEVKELFINHKLVVPVRRGRPKNTTPALTIQRLSDGATFDFDNIRSARTWLFKVEGLHFHQDTIMRRLERNITEPYRGFTFSPRERSKN